MGGDGPQTSLLFDGEQCVYNGPTVLAVWRHLTIAVTNESTADTPAVLLYPVLAETLTLDDLNRVSRVGNRSEVAAFLDTTNAQSSLVPPGPTASPSS